MSLSDMCLSDMGFGKVKDFERGLRGLPADDDDDDDDDDDMLAHRRGAMSWVKVTCL